MDKTILDYCIALVNLYGIVSLDRVVDTYNMQNERSICTEELEAAVNEYENYLRDNLVIVENNELIAMEIKMLDNYDKEKGYKGNNEYYN